MDTLGGDPASEFPEVDVMEPADARTSTVEDAINALWDGRKRLIVPKGMEKFEGYVWEIYRSITTQSIRIRVSDLQGRVHHYNSYDVTILN